MLLLLLLQALRLSEAEEKELLSIAEQQQQLLPDMQRGRWLQAWVEPSAAAAAAVAAAGPKQVRLFVLLVLCLIAVVSFYLFISFVSLFLLN